MDVHNGPLLLQYQVSEMHHFQTLDDTARSSAVVAQSTKVITDT